ncbi:short chain dehydrogenase domain-containing protein [Hirsutella rhossiliensis]|uniref:Short chain dehydrogenase domain-containing protein n=1 Tax=Hirsutella rhossiliensis TaxID=111463 RepID=A0A9P8SFN1_9HYPO|nr:short chain dehydrogenase domain-containing protein [Hirsutella rhossiliensis]KAH0960214.1 short chain dehydrogenase domain-containing protein [Hirsutella rhossiliensis]
MASTGALTKEDLFDLSGKVALITGGGSGLGLMMAQSLAANGAKVYICGRTKDKIETASQVHSKGAVGDIIPIQADVSSKEEIRALFDEIGSREKCLCILVNNAGVCEATYPVAEAKSADELKRFLFDSDKGTFDSWIDVYRTNVASVYFTTAAMLPLLQASTEQHPGWSGTVINVGSVSGVVQSAENHFSYNASKAAIRVNNIAPGVFPSEMTTGESDDVNKSHISKESFEGKVPAARPGKDEDMASTVLFLAANQYLNGQTVVVDGGNSLATGM